MRTRNRGLLALLTAATTILLAGSLAAQGLAPIDRGWYRSTGVCQTWNWNYFAGENSSLTEVRNWFVFDLSCVEGPITSATLVIDVGNLTTPQPSETYTLFDVTLPHADLMAGIGGSAAFDDLGAGTSYGSTALTFTVEFGSIAIPLNASGLAAANAALGGTFAFGGAITSLDMPTQEGAFGDSSGRAVRLLLDPPSNVRDATDRGTYNNQGSGHTGPYYSAGDWESNDDSRNYFVFDVADVDGLVTSATLALVHPFSPVSADPSETYTLFDVTTPLDQLTLGIASVAGFDDLGDGVVYGEYELTSADAATLVRIPLGPAGLAALNEQLGGTFAVGGAITTLDGDTSTKETAFGNYNPAQTITQILLEVESQWAYEGPGLAGTGGKVPLLTGAGELLGGDPASLSLVDALPGATAWFVMGLSSVNLPIKGGVLYPQPLILVAGLMVSPGGAIEIDTIWPLGVPSGTSAFYQYWIQDPAGPVGVAASNGLRSITP